MLLSLLASVIVVDQSAKWWAWRHAPEAIINDGGNPFVGAVIGGWYQDRVTGALLDLLAIVLLGVAASALVRHKRPAQALIPGALMIGGWSSNLLDRLGAHRWSAPGSARGAVDFIPLGHVCWNVADFFIVGATGVFLLVCCFSRSAGRRRLSLRARGADAFSACWQARRSSIVGAICLVGLVGVNAANCGGVTLPVSPGERSSSSATRDTTDSVVWGEEMRQARTPYVTGCDGRRSTMLRWS
jgi:lipoprotein signal peptidase